MSATILTEEFGRAGRSILADLTVEQARVIDPAICDRIQALGVPGEMLCGPYLHRTVAQIAAERHIPPEVLASAITQDVAKLKADEVIPEQGRDRPEQRLAYPVGVFDFAQELEALRHEHTWRDRDQNAKTLIKEPDFRLVLVALRQGAKLEQHRTPARITIQALAGRLRVHLPDSRVDMTAGQLLWIDRDIEHDVEALETASLLLTIAWPGPDIAEGERTA